MYLMYSHKINILLTSLLLCSGSAMLAAGNDDSGLLSSLNSKLGRALSAEKRANAVNKLQNHLANNRQAQFSASIAHSNSMSDAQKTALQNILDQIQAEANVNPEDLNSPPVPPVP